MFARAAILGVSSLCVGGCGLTGNFRSDLGYANFDGVKWVASDREVALSLGPLPLKLARLVLQEELELTPFLAELRGVRVYTYEGARDVDKTARRIDELEKELVGEGWLSILAMRNGDERVAVLLRPNERGGNHGLAVIVQDPSDLVLVNLIGNVRLDFIDAYMTELGVDAPSIDLDAAALQAAASSTVEDLRHQQ